MITIKDNKGYLSKDTVFEYIHVEDVNPKSSFAKALIWTFSVPWGTIKFNVVELLVPKSVQAPLVPNLYSYV